jgi:hypothetical protein
VNKWRKKRKEDCCKHKLLRLRPACNRLREGVEQRQSSAIIEDREGIEITILPGMVLRWVGSRALSGRINEQTVFARVALQYRGPFSAATSAPVLTDKFHPIKDIILLDRLASFSFVSICLECSSRRNDFLRLVGIDLAVSLLANFSLMPCFRVKVPL